MQFLIIQHVDYIEAGSVIDWIKQRGHRYKTHDVWLTEEEWPNVSDYDGLIIMGGPMSTYEEDAYPFLKEEKRFINEFISSGKPTIGICLGCQLLAEVLGGTVEKGNTEIGWHDVGFTKHMKSLDALPPVAKVFQWHNDVITLPKGAHSIGQSEANPIQGFVLKNVFAVQFHPEVKKENVLALLENDAEAVKNESKFIQSQDDILKGISRYQETGQQILFDAMDAHFRLLN